jgi:hypothetical protein
MTEEHDKPGPSGDPEADRSVSELEESNERVERHIEEAKDDWEAKQDDPRVPGAVHGPGDEEDQPQAAQGEHGEAADAGGQ